MTIRTLELAADNPITSSIAPDLVDVDLADFETADLPPATFAIDPLIPRGVVTLLGAHGGSGKSILALVIAAHVAVGRDWAGLRVDQGKAIFVSLEDSADMVRYRLKRIVEDYSLPAERVRANLRVLDGSAGAGTLACERRVDGVSHAVMTPNMVALFESITSARLVVVDNASDAFDGNENERRMVRGFLRMLGRLAQEADAGVLLLAHIDKAAARSSGAGNNYSGSTAWHNSVRSRLALVSESGLVELRHEKFNLGKRAESMALTWSNGGVLMPAGSVTAAASAMAERVTKGDADSVLVVLEDAHRMGVDVSTSRTGPSNGHRVLESFHGFPECLQGASGRRRFWSAIDLLLQDGRAVLEDYRNRDSKQRTRIVPVPAGSPARSFPPHPPKQPAGGSRRLLDGSAGSGTGGQLAETGGALGAEVFL